MDEFDCTFKWMPIMMLEGAKRTMGVQAAVESTRNEIVSRQDTLNNAIEAARNHETYINAPAARDLLE